MANLQKHSAHESLNTTSSADFQLQTVLSATTSTELNGDVSGYHTLIIQPSEDVYYGFSTSSTDMLGTAAGNLYLVGGDTIYELAIPHGLGNTVYYHFLGKTATSAIRFVKA